MELIAKTCSKFYVSNWSNELALKLCLASWKLPNSNSDIKGIKEAVCDWFTFKANAFEHGLNGLDAVKELKELSAKPRAAL